MPTRIGLTLSETVAAGFVTLRQYGVAPSDSERRISETRSADTRNARSYAPITSRSQTPLPTIPYLTQNYDPRTGMPRNRRQAQRQTIPYLSQGATPPAGGAPGGGGGQQYGPLNLPGYTPDYRSLISQALAPLQAQLGAEGSADAASRNAALIRGIGQFGEQFDPTTAQAAFGQDFYRQAGLEGWLPQANLLAGQNTQAGFSISSRLKTAFEKSVQQIQDALAARGLLRSGATGTALQGAQKEYEGGQYDARQSLMDYLSSAQQGFVAGERARQQQLLAAGREEAGRQAQLNPATGSQQAQYAGQNAPDGRPLYRRADGQLVFADGTPYTPATAAPPDLTQPQTDPRAAIQAALTRGREQRLGF